ncbi:DUF2958 domain-containing protein [Pseudotenacibaculum haliotis]|uniref:DUF2958 domain-containing protein n=1 Tax=Pseudotenacibaculum haliotis TaxID=1862138 RepID=A0ABW5LMX8_9FLAO
MKLITPELEARFKEIGDQSENENPLIVAKFFDPLGSATWYATEYDKETNTCFGYATGMLEDEWGYFSVSELESIQRFTTVVIDGVRHTSKLGLWIEREIDFKEIRFYDLFPEKGRLAKLNNSKKEKSQDQER